MPTLTRLAARLLVAATTLTAGRAVGAAEPTADAHALAARIDARIDAGLRTAGLPPSGPADDAEFVRRLWLDLHGVFPPYDRVFAFLSDPAADKRSRLIDELLAGPRFGQSMGERWKDVLAAPRTTDTDRVPVHLLAAWLADRFNRNRPWDETARDLLTATGTHEENGAVLVYLRNLSNYSKELKPHEATEVANRLWPALLGVDVHCAQCHDHKFAPVKQVDYWGMVAFLGKVRNDPPKGVKVRSLREVGPKPVYPAGMVNELLASEFDPRKVKPKFLFGEEPPLDPGGPFRPALAAWVTAPNNPYFARNFVNRTWAVLFGRGFAEPLTGFGEDEAPSHPELFAELADRFAAGGFDVKHLIRAVCNSKAYQRTSRPVDGNRDEKALFSRMPVKVLTPSQLYDSLVGLFGEPAYKPRLAGGAATPTAREAFLIAFEAEGGPTAYARKIPQALRLMNGPEFRKGREAFLERLAPPGRPADAVCDDLYLTLLARYPTQAERETIKAHVGKAVDPRRAYGQVLWALLNTSEFTLNH